MSPTIVTALAAHAIDLPLTEPFAIATGAQPSAQIVVVRCTLAGGAVGLGEAAPFFAVSGETQASALGAIEAARGLVVGKDAASWRPLAAGLADLVPEQAAARAAIEMALLDAWSRHHGVPLWSF